MNKYVSVKNIEFHYINVDMDGEYINFQLYIGDDILTLHENVWDDSIPVYAVLYNKVVNYEDYTLIIERNSVNYDGYRIYNIDENTVEFTVCFDPKPFTLAKCKFTRKKLLEMLKTPLIEALKDSKYMELIFNTNRTSKDYDYDEECDINKNPEYKKQYDKYFLMLQKQIVPKTILKKIEEYNQSKPGNVLGEYFDFDEFWTE